MTGEMTTSDLEYALRALNSGEHGEDLMLTFENDEVPTEEQMRLTVLELKRYPFGDPDYDLAMLVAQELEANMTGSNPPEGGIPDNAPPDESFPDGTAFVMATCNHTELPYQDIEVIEDTVDRRIGSNPDDLEEAINTELLLEDQGIDPPPWVRFPETFNTPLDAVTLPAALGDEGSQFRPMSPFGREYGQEILAANPLHSGALVDAHLRGFKVGRFGKGIRAGGIAGKEVFEINAGNLLSSNPKLSKGGKECYVSAGLALAPWGTSGIANICPYASKGCAAGCLNISGLAEVGTRTKFATEIEARKRRTVLLFNNRSLFTHLLPLAVAKWERVANMDSQDWGTGLITALGTPSPECPTHKLAIRMNVLSDLPWEQIKLGFPEGLMNVFERFPNYQFYDYTKDPTRMMNFVHSMYGYHADWPSNYYLTFSWSEINARLAFSVLDAGGNVAMPFDLNPKFKPHPEMPTEWCGYPVIDADVHDLRFLDMQDFAALRAQYGTGVICGLRMKGVQFRSEFMKAKKEERADNLPMGALTGGFVQYADDAGVVDGRHYDASENQTNTGTYKAKLIALSDQRALAQEQDPEGWKQRGFRASPIWMRDR